jgi:hypothetical protein
MQGGTTVYVIIHMITFTCTLEEDQMYPLKAFIQFKDFTKFSTNAVLYIAKGNRNLKQPAQHD